MEIRKTTWLAIAVVGLLLCGLGMGLVPGSNALLPLRQALAQYEATGIIFPMDVAADIYVADPAGVNTTFLPVRVAVNTEDPPARVEFVLDVTAGPDVTFDVDDEIPFIGHLLDITDGVGESYDIDADAYGPDVGTYVNTVSRPINVFGLPDDDANGIPNDPLAVPAGGVWVAEAPGPVYSVVASVGSDTMGMTDEMGYVVTGSDVTLGFTNEILAEPFTDGRLVVRTAATPDDIDSALGALALPTGTTIVAIDAHLLDDVGNEVDAPSAPIMVHVPVAVTDEVGIPIYYTETDLDSNYDVLVTGTAYEQLPVETNIVDNELVFPIDSLTAYVPMLVDGAPIINSIEPPAAGPIAGCAPVTINASGSIDEENLTVQFGDNDAVDVVVTINTPELTATITCLAPGGDALGAVDVFITNPDVGGEGFDIFAMLADAFTYLPSTPVLFDIDPASGPARTRFTITASGVEPGAVVTFDGVLVTDAVVSVDCAGAGPTNTITGRVPRGLAEGLVTVRVQNPASGTEDTIFFNLTRRAEEVAVGGGGRGGAGGPCFVATATYGTSMADQLEVLRTFRDKYLLTNAAGTALMKAYYKYSPGMANAIADSSLLRAVTRAVLTPIVALLVMPLWIKLALVSLAVAAVALIRRRVHA